MRNRGGNQDQKLPLEAILFDLGGTLIYFQGQWQEVLAESSLAMLRSLLESGILLDQRKFLSRFRERLEQYFSERESEFIEYTTGYVLRNLLTESGYPDVPDTIVQQALKNMYQVSQAYWQPEEDAIPVLDLLRAQGYRLALISNASDDADVQALIDKAQLRPFFELILTSAAAGIRKPNPRILQIALDALQIEPQEAVMVGDTLGADILGAHNAGIPAIWITRHADNSANRAHLDTIQADYTIETLRELPGLLNRIL